MFWYCAFCGKYHTSITPAYDFSGWRRRGRIKTRDSLCDKGMNFVSLFKESFGSLELSDKKIHIDRETILQAVQKARHDMDARYQKE